MADQSVWRFTVSIQEYVVPLGAAKESLFELLSTILKITLYPELVSLLVFTLHVSFSNQLCFVLYGIFFFFAV